MKSVVMEQISWAIFQGGGLWSTTFVSIYQMFVLVCSFKIQRLPPWQTLHNSSIQDGCHFLKSTPIQKCSIFFTCLHCNAPFHVRILSLYISSKKKNDNLGTTVIKSRLDSQMHVPKVFHLGMFLMANYL